MTEKNIAMIGITKLISIWNAIWNFLLLPEIIISQTDTSSTGIYQMQSKVRSLVPVLTERSDYFSYYRVNLYRSSCPLWENDNAMCSNQGCAVKSLNEIEIPKVWKKLSDFEPHSKKNDTKCNWKYNPDLDYCYLDNSTSPDEYVYVSLVQNPERFTGYAGDHSAAIWRSIYEQNCFVVDDDDNPSEQPKSNALFRPNQIPLNLFTENHDDTSLSPSVACLEKRMFNRIISGFHASISTHVCQNYYDVEEQRWTQNLDWWRAKVGSFPDRIENIFFNYALLHQALVQIATQMKNITSDSSFTFCPTDKDVDWRTHTAFEQLVYHAYQDRHVINREQFFADEEAKRFKDSFRKHFRDISRIMDCVGCDKCRLWGKVQITGYGTALKLLLEPETQLSDLRPEEVVALVNTFDRISHSVEATFWFSLKAKTNDTLDAIKALIYKTYRSPSKEILAFFIDQTWYLFYALFFICNVPRVI